MMSTLESGDLVVTIVTLPAFEQLAIEWRDLEERSDGSFFTSWSWIGALLRTLPALPGLRLVRVAIDGRTVGLCLVNRRTTRWRGSLSLTTLHFNATGDTDLDRITPEYNDVLCERELAQGVRRKIMEAWLAQEPGWDEFHLAGAAPNADWAAARPDGQALVAEVRDEPCYAVDLVAVRSATVAEAKHIADSRERFLSLLSSNTRAQIRRSLKEYGKLGTLRVDEASTLAQAFEFFDGLRALHQAYWISRGEPGAFGHPYFEAFHRRLIEDAFARQEAQLIRVKAGDVLIGYVYNFVWRGQVLNYQSGFDYAVADKHARPGLVVQALAVALNADRGAKIYDFMAGANRSKESLSTLQYKMDWIVLRRPRLKFWVDQRLRSAKRTWQAHRPGDRSARLAASTAAGAAAALGTSGGHSIMSSE